MDKITEVTQATLDRLMSNYYLWIGLLSIVLAFAIYVYLFPKAIEFFKNPEKSGATPTEKDKEAPPHTSTDVKNEGQD